MYLLFAVAFLITVPESSTATGKYPDLHLREYVHRTLKTISNGINNHFNLRNTC